MKGKPRHTPPKKPPIFLWVQVFQNGILQVEKQAVLASLFSRRIRIGSRAGCELHVPYESVLRELALFSVGRGRACVYLDPRLDGFVYTGSQYGDVKDFTEPSHALGVLTSVDDPLPLELTLGSRGKLKIHGFEIVFKVAGPRKKAPDCQVPQLGGSFFQMAATDIPLEHNVIGCGLLAMACVFIPLLYWLCQYPTQKQSGLAYLPPSIAAQFIAPENIRLLPYVFGEQYQDSRVTGMALIWISALQARWEHAERGVAFTSPFAFLNIPVRASVLTRLDEAQHEVVDRYAAQEKNHLNDQALSSYYSQLKPSPFFTTWVPENGGRTNTALLEKRLGQLRNADEAILEYLKLEHGILKRHYEKYLHAKKKGIVMPPQTGQVLGPQPDPIFNVEFKNYKNAEEIAQIAQNSRFRQFLAKHQGPDESAKTVVLGKGDFWYPMVFAGSEMSDEANAFAAVAHNVKLSQDYVLPPPPKPKPIIDQKLVEFVLFNRKEELRSCYDAALRRHPHLKGTLQVGWWINGQGRAEGIQSPQGRSMDGGLWQCVQARIHAWQFPKSINGPSYVQFPLQFFIQR